MVRRVKNQLPNPASRTPTGSREVTPEPDIPALFAAPTTLAERHHRVPSTDLTFLQHLAQELRKDETAVLHYHSGEGISVVVTDKGRRAYYVKKLKDGKEKKVPTELLFVGEVGAISDGTALGAFGSSTEGQGIVRWRFPSSLATLGQLATCDSIVGNEEANESKFHPGWDALVAGKRIFSTEFLYSHSKDPDVPRDIITLQTEGLYGYPERGEITEKTLATPQKQRHARNTVGGSATATPEQDVVMEDAAAAPLVVQKAGTTYPRAFMPGADSLTSQGPRIRQFKILDVDGTTIPPWEMADKFTPGTLVRATATPTCWIFTKPGSVDKRYMLIIKSLQVIAPVETPAEDHLPVSVPVARTVGVKRKADDDDSDDEASTFQTFGSPPAKKPRAQ
ncbi:hypothetical protein C8F01DRAFT_1139991 [Mycena amicta]|nr:hypothetical protein C8F01DRAFT_1139991 [Mycena amicta]